MNQTNQTQTNTAILLGVIACFILSGFAALLYQTAWMRQFSLVFGTSELAVAAVLACLLYTSPSPRDRQKSRMPSSA